MFGFARLNEDGTTDTAFQPTGAGIVTAISVTTDEKILTGSTDGVLRRYLSNGALDTNVVFEGVHDSFVKIIAEPDGGILAVLEHCGGNCFCYPLRFMSSGFVDTNFLVKPRSNYPVIPPQEGGVTDMALQDDGSIFICGQFTNVNCLPRAYLARLVRSAAPDALPCPPRPEPTLTVTRARAGVMYLCVPDGYGDYWVQAARHLNRRHPERTRWVNVATLGGYYWWDCDGTNCCIDVSAAKFGRHFRLVKRS